MNDSATELTMDKLKLLIAEEDHARAEQGPSKSSRPGAFLLAAMEVEDQQCESHFIAEKSVLIKFREAVRLEAKRRNRTSAQAAELQRKRTLLLGMVQRLRDEQAHFMPGLTRLLEENPSDESSTRPEEMKLYLPSTLPARTRNDICVGGLPAQEERLRAAQAREALSDLRRQLRTRTMAHQFKRRHMDGQAAYTKSQALQSAIEQKIKAATSRYNAARGALLALRGPGVWEETLRELQASDIRGMNERAMNEEEKREEQQARRLAGLDIVEVDEFGENVEPTVLFNLATGEGRRSLSWIWYTESGAPADVGENGQLHDGAYLFPMRLSIAD
jgi:hypothetical protein